LSLDIKLERKFELVELAKTGDCACSCITCDAPVAQTSHNECVISKIRKRVESWGELVKHDCACKCMNFMHSLRKRQKKFSRIEFVTPQRFANLIICKPVNLCKPFKARQISMMFSRIEIEFLELKKYPALSKSKCNFELKLKLDVYACSRIKLMPMPEENQSNQVTLTKF